MKELNYTEQEITFVRNAISQEGINLTDCRLDGIDRLVMQMIRQWPEEKPLLKLCLTSCPMSQTAWKELFQSLSSGKHVIHLDLSMNFLGEAGHELAQSIKSWGDEPSLQAELLQSLSSGKQLSDLDLSFNTIGEAGRYLAQSITSWGDNPPLQKLNLGWCSISEQLWAELLQSLSSCKQLSHLDLSGNTIGEAGRYLAQSITSWGDNPPLQDLYLRYCSIPEQVWPELLQSLSSCKQLSHLDLRHNMIGEAGRYLAQSIASWGDNPPLGELDLGLCSIPEQVWPELLQSLSSCKQLVDLDLSHNTMDEAGRYLAQAIRSWGDNPPLQKLDLGWCSIPEQVMAELLQSLSSCEQLVDLDLSHNTMGEAGRYLAQSIRSWGDNPPLQKLDLGRCSIPEQVWAELLQSLSSCKQLIYLDLSRNTIGEAGHYLAQSIRSWGDNPPLKILDLERFSIPEQVMAELLQSLSSCKQLIYLDLSFNTIGEAGRYLAQSIRSWGDNPPLQNLDLGFCSIPEQVWAELLQSLSSCEQLVDLDLSHNTMGEAGHYLAQSIRSWGDNPPLQKLDLGWCSIPEQVMAELLQSLSSCKQLIYLDLSRNTIGEAGHYLTQSIRSWGDNPPLKILDLERCSIPEQVMAELLQSLSSCKQLIYLDLSFNTIGEAGRYLAQSIRSWGDNPPLQNLDLGFCSIPEQVWAELLQSLSSCEQLVDLDLSHNTMGEAGRYLAQSIRSWGDNPPLQKLDLGWCSIPEQVMAELLQSLSSCKQLICLVLSRNTIGEAGHYLAQSIRSWGDNPPLKILDLERCSIPEQVMAELLQSLSSCKQLIYLDLSFNTIGEAGRYLAQSIRSWGDNPPLQNLDLGFCSIPEQVWAELLQSLSSCEQLVDLDLSHNTMCDTGRYLAQSIRSWGDNPPLQKLDLGRCSIPEQVWAELLQSLSSCKQLSDLDLSYNTIGEAGRYLAQSIRSWGDEPPLQKLGLYNCSLTAAASLELVQSLFLCKHLEYLNLEGNDFNEAGFNLAESPRSSVQCVYLPHGPTVTAAQCYPSVTVWDVGDDNMSSDESNGHYCSDNSNSELGVYSETEQDEQFDNEGIATAGNAIQKIVQRPRYHEDTTEFGINIRRYEDERPESPVLTSLDSVVAGAVGVVGNLSLGNNAADKYPVDELRVTNIMYFAIKNKMFPAKSDQILRY